MKIVLASPLYPPDIAEPAPYTKELARRLSDSHDVTVVTYGSFPEKVEGVEIQTVSKQQPIFSRLIRFLQYLLKATNGADLLIVENGPSTELPLLFLRMIRSIPIVFHTGDKLAEDRVRHSTFLRLVEATATRSSRILHTSPESKPEILPFFPYPQTAMDAYTASWEKHIESLLHSSHGK